MEKAFKETNRDDDPPLSRVRLEDEKEKNIYGNGKVSYKLHSVQFSRSVMSDSCLWLF